MIGTDWRPIKGLYCCGELVGGLFYDNYPAGTGLVSGATFGRIAGRNAAAADKNETENNMSEASLPNRATAAFRNLASKQVLAFDKRPLTKRSIAPARTCILDTIGVTLAG